MGNKVSTPPEISGELESDVSLEPKKEQKKKNIRDSRNTSENDGQSSDIKIIERPRFSLFQVETANESFAKTSKNTAKTLKKQSKKEKEKPLSEDDLKRESQTKISSIELKPLKEKSESIPENGKARTNSIKEKRISADYKSTSIHVTDKPLVKRNLFEVDTNKTYPNENIETENILREPILNSKPRKVVPSLHILRRMSSFVDATPIIEKQKIEFDKSNLTLQDNFTGKRLIDWFLESFKESMIEEGPLKTLAETSCSNLLKIRAIMPCDPTDFNQFNKNSLYKWSMSINYTPKVPQTPSSRLSVAHFNFNKDQSSELCRNCKKSRNDLDVISSEIEKIKKPKECESQSTQTIESSFVKKIQIDESEKKEDENKLENDSEKAPLSETKCLPIPPPPPLISKIETKTTVTGPPPPPIPGVGPPPPPVIGTGPLPPPIPGKGPPPLPGSGPPLPPGMKMPGMAAQGPRKPVVKPAKPMRVLHWNRILVPENDTGKGKFWLQISEQKLDNIENFVELFNTEKKKSSKEPKETTKSKASEPKSIKVLDGKRSQNVGIAIRKLDIEDIKYALFNCKTTSGLAVEDLMNIEKLKATDEEIMNLNNVEDVDRLDAPEAWLYKLTKIDSLSERIFCIVTQTEFETSMFQVSHKLSLINSLSNFFIENENLKKLISIILTLGNYLNGGNAQKGQADGFGLEILEKLKDVKSNDPKTTLLHFVVKTYIGLKDSIQCSPVPDTTEVEKASLIDFSECEIELNKMNMDVKNCKNKLENVILKNSSDENQEAFKTAMEDFIYQAEKKIKERQEDLKRCKDTFQKTVDHYSVVLKSSSDVKNPGQFFEKWVQFVTDFNEIYKAEVTIIREKLEKLKKKKNNSKAQTKSTSENSLKSKMVRLISKQCG